MDAKVRAGHLGRCVAGILALGLLAAHTSHAAFPGENGRIAFERGAFWLSVDINSEIWTMRPDGSHLEPVFKRKGDGAYGPEISPSGRRIAFKRDRPGLWIMRSDGRKVRRLLRGSAFDPAFSPNGKMLAYSSQRGHGKRIFLTSLSEAGRGEPLARFRGSAEGEAAFVGNRRIVYTSFDGEGFQLYSVRTDGTGRRQLTQGDDEAVGPPDVAPSGRRVTFVDFLADEICVMDLATTSRRCFVPDGVEDPNELLWSKFSPNGRKLVYWEDRNGIIKVNRDGSHAVRLSSGGARAPDWGPRPD